MRNSITNWPENAAKGSMAMHLHYRNLVDLWNFGIQIESNHSRAHASQAEEKIGLSAFTFRDVPDVTAFTKTFRLVDCGLIKGIESDGSLNGAWSTKLYLRNEFPWENLEAFFSVLDAKRIELMNINREWDTMRPTLNSVFTQSGRVFHRMKNAHDAITEARCALGNSVKGSEN